MNKISLFAAAIFSFLIKIGFIFVLIDFGMLVSKKHTLILSLMYLGTILFDAIMKHNLKVEYEKLLEQQTTPENLHELFDERKKDDDKDS